MAEPAPAHSVHVRRYAKGYTATRPTRVLYGTSGVCREPGCDWSGRSNLPPSRGGRRDIADQHRAATTHRAEIIG